MNGKVDLHVHTNASDGKHSPAELTRLAISRGLSFLAITDHDTVAGVEGARRVASECLSLSIISGVEISSHAPGSEVHILGYFVDTTNAEFLQQMAALSEARQNRAKAIIEKLNGLGLDISIERVHQIAKGGSIGRPHIAQVLLEKGYVASFQEVFMRYLGQGCPAYVERVKISPEDAVELVLRSGGLPVLAHPTTVAGIESVVMRLVMCGLSGIECYYKDYSALQRQELVSIAKRFDLIPTGGSDYHGIDMATEVMLGEASVPIECVDNLVRLKKERDKQRGYQGG